MTWSGVLKIKKVFFCGRSEARQKKNSKVLQKTI